MNDKVAPNYTEFEGWLSETQLGMCPAEAHGLMAGLMVGKLPIDAHWKAWIAGESRSPALDEALQALFDVSHAQFDADLFEFQMYLPTDDASLPVRAEALTLWCQGFLTGLKLVDIKVDKKTPTDVAEAIGDITEIAKMNYEQVVANDEDEDAYIELIEYIRMAVIFIYQTMHQQDGVTTASATSRLH